ncbi:WD40 repeat domain-containing protein [Streptomyces sp. NPDC051310]|uniref:WD40 repeat domain-containing protein n=1 Tax=Streptomyces sp. NPDC051310 TaxID=3365649 RepID=UPI003795CE87
MSRYAAVWQVANRLGVVAGTPGELLSAVLAGPPGTLRIPLAPDDDLARSLRALGHVDVVTEHPPARPPAAPVDLGDPAAVCAADPLGVTEAYESDPDPRGGLRAAWLRAGQSLVRDQDPADRALVLLAALDGTADPRLRTALAERAAAAAWNLVGSSRRRCTALTTTPGGRRAVAAGPAERITALACLPDGTRLVLDERGRLHPRGGPGTRLTAAVAATLDSHPATALAAAGDTVLTGDRMGTVHAFSLRGVHQAALHSGRVTALTAPAPGSAYSGGTDGTVRAWRPGRAPGRTPVARRPHPVTALHATGRLLAVAWADGLAELHRLDTGEVAAFRPGPRIRAVAVTDDGTLVLGLDETLLHLAYAGRTRPERSCG